MKAIEITVKRIRPRLKPIHGAPDLLPFINVFFLLLFFFFLGNSFIPVSGIPVNLPESPSVSIYSVKKYIVTLDKQNHIYFNDTVIEDLNQLKGKLLSDVVTEKERGTIVLRADKDSNFEKISQIMALAEELKLNIFILSRKNTSKRTVFTEVEKP